jgi:hypothetical protein
MPVDSFDEWIAARYEQLWPELFAPAVIDPAVDFLQGWPGPVPPSNSESAPAVSPCR